MQLVLSLSIYSIAAGKSYHRHSPFADVNARLALLLVAVLIPVLALLGFAQGVREVRRSYPDPAWRAVNLQSSITGSPAQNRVLAEMRNGFILGFLGLLTLVVAARRVRAWQETRLKGLAIAHPDGLVCPRWMGAA